VVEGGREHLLLTGDKLTVPLDAPAAVPATSSPSYEPAPAPPRPLPEATSTLAKENALLAAAMAQRGRHHEGRALALVDELLRAYPTSPLVETARVERLRILEDTGDMVQLRKDAARYIADYPRGFARAEVTRMLASASP